MQDCSWVLTEDPSLRVLHLCPIPILVPIFQWKHMSAVLGEGGVGGDEICYNPDVQRVTSINPCAWWDEKTIPALECVLNNPFNWLLKRGYFCNCRATEAEIVFIKRWVGRHWIIRPQVHHHRLLLHQITMAYKMCRREKKLDHCNKSKIIP